MEAVSEPWRLTVSSLSNCWRQIDQRCCFRAAVCLKFCESLLHLMIPVSVGFLSVAFVCTQCLCATTERSSAGVSLEMWTALFCVATVLFRARLHGFSQRWQLLISSPVQKRDKGTWPTRTRTRTHMHTHAHTLNSHPHNSFPVWLGHLSVTQQHVDALRQTQKALKSVCACRVS